MRQFLTQAMPIFLLLCVLSAALDYSGALQPISRVLAPVMALFQLPSELSLSLVVSVLRKDGMLLMNSGNGETLRSLSSSQLFLAVYLSSTLTACIVTLWTVQKELGLRHAALLAGRQALTSVVTAFLLALALMPRSNYLAG
jgi:Fe2+ transport system protein B